MITDRFFCRKAKARVYLCEVTSTSSTKAHRVGTAVAHQMAMGSFASMRRKTADRPNTSPAARILINQVAHAPDFAKHPFHLGELGHRSKPRMRSSSWVASGQPENPDLMGQRRCAAEHPFGTIKRMTAGGRFLTRGITKVKAELSASWPTRPARNQSHWSVRASGKTRCRKAPARERIAWTNGDSIQAHSSC